MRLVKFSVLILFLLQCFVAAQAQMPNSAQEPPAVNAQQEAPSTPAVASPAGVTPVIPATGVVKPSGPAAPALAGQMRVKRVALLDIKGAPGFNGAAFVNGFLVMSHSANNSVDVFDVRKRRLVAQIPDMQGAGAIAEDPKSQLVYVANLDGNDIAVISSQDWKLVRRIAVQDAPGGLMLMPEDNTLYCASSRQQIISLIDLIQGKQISRVAIEGSPQHMAFDARRHQIYATLEPQNEVAVFDPGLKLLRTFKLNASEPTGVVYDRQTDRLYVAVRYAVLALDPETGRETARVAAPAGVDTLVLDPAGQMLYVAAEGGSIQMIRTAGRLTVEQEVNTEVRGHMLAFDPNGGMLFLPGGRDGRAKLLLLKQVSMGAPPTQQTAEK